MVDIAWFRDLFLCIFGVVATVVLVFLAVLGYSLYRRLKVVLNSAKATAKTVEGISTYVGDEVMKPILQIAALIQGLRHGIDSAARFFRRREGGKDER